MDIAARAARAARVSRTVRVPRIRSGLFIAGLVLTLGGGGTAAAQGVPGFDNAISERQVRIGEDHIQLKGQVELRRGDLELYADEVEIYTDSNRAVASGNVVLVQTGNRIAADRADFNTKTRLGTFYNAYGFAFIKPQAPRPGAVAVPPPSSQETDVYFQGETVEKIGPKKYKITNGGFTTCVQPTPRWQLQADTVVLSIDNYTLLRSATFSVKGVPFLYVPVLYYPTKKDDRATGLLIPTYGSSALRGQSLHNAFFWVIDRSQDMTFTHDWFSKTGWGAGSEYRYNYGPGSNGNIRWNLLDEHETSYVQDDGSVQPLPASRSYEVHGGATETLPGNLRARGRVDYFSSIVEMQSVQMNTTSAYQNQRSYGGNIVGAWSNYSLNATLDHTDYFGSATASSTSGNWPRVSFARNERLIPDTPLYFSVGAEYVGLLNHGGDTAAPENDYNRDVTRYDVTPQVRFPFKKWQWFTVNSTVAWRDTYYTRSLSAIDPSNPTAAQTVTNDPLNRAFYTLSTQITGPVFNRIWDTPDNGYAEKFKHTVEPFLNIAYTSPINNFAQIIQIDGTDTIVGGNTQYAYGLNNRFYAKRPGEGGRPSQAREIFDVSLSQTYYTNSQASQYDPRYTSATNNVAPSNFSPILLTLRGMPTNSLNATASIEIDSRYLAVRQISAGGNYNWTGLVVSNVSWSKQGYIEQLAGFNDKSALSQAVNAQTNVHTRDNAYGGIYSFSYDVTQGKLLNQRLSGFYNSQCCGVAFDYQVFNYGGITAGLPVPSDHRFFLSFTLAGLGNFSPFNGAMSGVPH
jgi:lipopolysaccharide assembly outer membrane protein LptD (OstA)